MSGNLELILDDKMLYAYTEDPSCHVYRALLTFARHRGNNYERWFYGVASGLHLRMGDRLTEPDDRLVIDVPRRVIQYIDTFALPKGFRAAKERLRERYRIQVHKSGEFPLKEG
jgi:hypothetical protein